MSFKTKETWVLLSNLEIKIKEKIEEKGIPLKDWNITINYGIKTGCNEVFIINKEIKDKILQNCKTIEESTRTDELIRPVLRGRDIGRNSFTWNNLWIIALLPSRHYAINQYPSVEKYLLTFGKERLVQEGKKFLVSGKEVKSRKKTNNKWFETQDSISYWEDFYKPKIIYSEIVQKPQFLLDTENFFPEASSFIMSGEHLDYLIKILNSGIYCYIFKTFYAGGGLGGSGYRYKKKFLLNLPVPKFSNSDIMQKIINSTDDKIIEKLIAELLELSDEEAIYIYRNL